MVILKYQGIIKGTSGIPTYGLDENIAKIFRYITLIQSISS